MRASLKWDFRPSEWYRSDKDESMPIKLLIRTDAHHCDYEIEMNVTGAVRLIRDGLSLIRKHFRKRDDF